MLCGTTLIAAVKSDHLNASAQQAACNACLLTGAQPIQVTGSSLPVHLNCSRMTFTFSPLLPRTKRQLSESDLSSGRVRSGRTYPKLLILYIRVFHKSSDYLIFTLTICLNARTASLSTSQLTVSFVADTAITVPIISKPSTLNNRLTFISLPSL